MTKDDRLQHLKMELKLQTAKDLALKSPQAAYPAHPKINPFEDLSTIPLYETRISAGTPLSIEDNPEQSINLHEYLAPHPKQTFCVRVEGNSMIGAGISPNDLLIVNTQQKPKHGDIVVAAIDNELTVKRLKCSNNHIVLLPENLAFKPLVITEFMHFQILGVVQHIVHSF